MATTTRTRKSGATVKSDAIEAARLADAAGPIISDIPTQSDVPVIEDIPAESDVPDSTDESDIPVISDEVAQILAFAANWDASDKTGDTGQLVTNYRTAVGNEAYATYARAVTVEAANRTFGATVAGGMFHRIDDKPGASDKTIGKGQVSNLSGSVKLFQKCELSVSSIPLVWARLSTSGGWRDKRNTPQCADMVRAVQAATDESDKVDILLGWDIPVKDDKPVDTTAELVKAAENLAKLAEAYGNVTDQETRGILDKHLTSVRTFLAIPAVIGVTR